MPELRRKFASVANLSKLINNLRGLNLIRTAAGSLGLKIGAAALGFINGVLLARLLGPAEFGLYSIILSIINFAATLAVIGLPTFITREVAASVEYGHWNQLKGLLRTAHLGVFFATLAILSAFSILLVSGLVKSISSWTVIIVAMILVPLIAFNQLRASILRGLHWVILADIPELLLRPIVMLILLIGAYFAYTNISTANALGMQLAAIILALVAGTWWLYTRQPELLKAARCEPPQFARLLGTLPFLGIALIAMAEGQVALYLLGYLSGTKQAGLFQAANQIVGLISIGLVAVNMPLQPKLAAAWARKDKPHAQKLITETAHMGAVISLAGVLIVFIFAEIVLGLYGSQYVEAADALRILAVGQIVNAAAGSCGILLMMTGHQKVVMLGMVLALLLNICIAYWAIPLFGVAGGALAATVGMVFWNVFYVIYALFRLRLNTTIFH